MKRNADRPESTPVPLLPLAHHADVHARREVLVQWAARASAVELDRVLHLVAVLPSAEADVVAFPTVRA